MYRPKRLRHRAFGLFEAIVIIILILLIAIFIFMYTRVTPRGYIHRPTCRTNLYGIGIGLQIYANENNNYFPIAPHAPATQDSVGRVTYAPGIIGTHRGREDVPDAGQTSEEDTEMSATRNLWMLVRHGSLSPRGFICPLSGDKENDDGIPQHLWDFRNYSEISYGYQVPYGKYGQPATMRAHDMPLAADKGPFGAALEAGKPHPGINMPNSNASPGEWTPWNSPNHGGEGQNVLYADGSVRFETTPIVGVKKDNIYTRWAQADGGSDTDEIPRIHGTPPTGTETPWSDTDSLIYP